MIKQNKERVSSSLLQNSGDKTFFRDGVRVRIVSNENEEMDTNKIFEEIWNKIKNFSKEVGLDYQFSMCAVLKNGRYQYEGYYKSDDNKLCVDRLFMSIGNLPCDTNVQTQKWNLQVDAVYDRNGKICEFFILVKKEYFDMKDGDYFCDNCGGNGATCDCPED